MTYKRLTLLAGHYGSGKTNIAVNLAMDIRKKNHGKVAIADLDIVNPYFRTKDSMEQLTRAGITLLSSPYAGSNVDVPAIPQEMYALTDDRSLTAVIDIGGDDRGALALGRYAPRILEENNFEFYGVINCYRPLTADVPSTIEVLEEIRLAGGLPFTGLINNSNLGDATRCEDVIASVEYANSVAKATGLPVVMTTVKESLYSQLKDQIPDLFPLGLQTRIFDNPQSNFQSQKER